MSGTEECRELIQSGDPELAGEAFDWFTNGSLTWPIGHLRVDRSWLLEEFESRDVLEPAGDVQFRMEL